FYWIGLFLILYFLLLLPPLTSSLFPYTTLFRSHGVKTENQASALHAASLACPALPTCGLALAESERMLPGLIDRIEALCARPQVDRKSTRLNSSHLGISYAVFCLKKKKHA